MSNLGNPALLATAAASSLTPQERKVIGIGVGLVLVGTVYLGYRAWKNFTGTKADDDAKEMGANLRDLKANKYNVTLKDGEAQLIAQQIFDAMNIRGTDFDTIFRNLMQLKTRDDLLYVIISFGIKQYGVTGEADSWIARKTGYSTPLNMNGWLLKELKDKQLTQIKEIYNKLNVPL